jgi:hypothetical protein
VGPGDQGGCDDGRGGQGGCDQDWPAALRRAGFDANKPTAWNVEGLMIGFLPPDAEDQAHGWGTVGATLADLFAAAGLAPLQGDNLEIGPVSIVYVTATKK